MAAELRHRVQPVNNAPPPKLMPQTSSLASAADLDKHGHPSGQIKHGRVVQILREVSFVVYFLGSCIAYVSPRPVLARLFTSVAYELTSFLYRRLHLGQFLGAPLYFWNREMYYSFMSIPKQSFGILITTITQWFSPTTIRISGDASVAGQIKQKADGRVEFSFPERMVLIANHQIYTDWLYLWWVAYANSPQMHGWIYIILKESLRFIPVIGPGMMFFSFIFMSRKMAVDRPRLAHRLAKLKTAYTHTSTHISAADGKSTTTTTSYLNPMWLLLFPEGTNASDNGRVKSAAWAAKNGIADPRHVLLPRSTGMYFCLCELAGSVEWVYDCTVAYEGIPRGRFGEEYFTLSSTYFQGRPPRSVNFHWRRFRVADIPLGTAEAFDAWLRERWYEKDELMEEYVATGRFPASVEAVSSGHASSKGDGYIETEVRTRWALEFLQPFVVIGSFALVVNILWRVWSRFAGIFS